MSGILLSFDVDYILLHAMVPLLIPIFKHCGSVKLSLAFP
jgi:hypothetical protein